VRAWPGRASGVCPMGNAVMQRMAWTKETRMGYGTRPHDWELDELGSMKNSVSVSVCVVSGSFL
jgi:hypothetical protein